MHANARAELIASWRYSPDIMVINRGGGGVGRFESQWRNGLDCMQIALPFVKLFAVS